jgi:hypothetical protein
LSTPAQSEGKTLQNPIRSPSDSAAISPFRNEAARTPAHLGLSTPEHRGKRNDNIFGPTGEPSPVSSTARDISDVASLSATNLIGVTSPASDLSFGILGSSPPAYEAIPADRH